MLDTTSGIIISGRSTRESFRESECFHGGAREDPRWYAVQTEYRMPEQAVCQRIGHLDVPSFLPIVSVKRRRGTRNEIAQVAMFPRYLFVRFDVRNDQWRRVAHVQGVRRIFGAGPEQPIPVPTRAIDAMVAAGYGVGETEDSVWTLDKGRVRLVRKDIRPALIAAGVPVKITRGAFADQTGVCLMSAGNRIRILLDMFGKEVNAELAHVVEAEAAAT